MSKLSLVNKAKDYPARLSPLALTFEAEIKRIAAAANRNLADVMRELSKASGVTENHLYNYRNGKTDIPGSLIRIFCSMFSSCAPMCCMKPL